MSSAWGESWGLAWGDAWGATTGQQSIGLVVQPLVGTNAVVLALQPLVVSIGSGGIGSSNSAWGLSWGLAWGDAWGSSDGGDVVASVVVGAGVAVIAGGRASFVGAYAQFAGLTLSGNPGTWVVLRFTRGSSYVDSAPFYLGGPVTVGSGGGDDGMRRHWALRNRRR